MAYDLKQERVLGNGLNWLAPSDLIHDAEAIELSNLRVDEFGGIRTRPGHSLVASALGSVNSLIKANGIRYSGDSTSLHRALTGAAIAGGFDGNPLGMVSWKGFLLVTNKNNPTTFSSPVKDNGSTVTRMIPAAPVAAPVVTKGAEKVTVVSTMDNSETWTESAGTKSFDAADKKAGSHSLKLVTADPGIYTLTRTATPDLSSVGGQTGTDDDKHRVWIKVDDFTQTGDINLLVDVSVAADFSDYYRARIPRKKIRKAHGNWVQFEIRRDSTAQDVLVADPGSIGLLESISGQEFTPREEVSFQDHGASTRALISAEALTFERIGNDDTRTWANVTQIRIEIEVFGITTLRFDEWEVFGSIIGSLEGKNIVHYYTYVDSAGRESNPSPGSTPGKFNRRAAAVALIASTDPQVTGINVYRGGGTLGQTYRVNGTTPIANATASYADINSDETLFTDDFLLEFDHDDPPAAAIFAGPYNGRIIAASSTANLNRYWWSAVNQFYFPGAADAAGNWNDVGGSGEAIVAVTVHEGYLLIWKSNSIWRVIGDPDDSGGQYEFVGVKHGVVGPKALTVGEQGVFFCDTEGVYLFAGRTAQKISQKISPIFRGQTVTLASGLTIPPISSSARSKTVLELVNGRLYISYPESGQSVNNVTIVYHVESGRWYRDSRSFSALYNEANTLLAGTSGGTVLALETGTADIDTAIPIAYQSKYYDMGAPDAEKTINDFEIEYSSPVTLTVTAYLNNGTSLALGTVPASASVQKKTLQFNEENGQKAFNCSIRITGSADTEIYIKGLWLHYYLEARKGSSFDTDELDMGVPGVKEYRQIELDIDCAATTELKILTDLPSNAMTLRETLAIPVTAGRRIVPKLLNMRERGYLSRFTIDDSTAQFQLYGGKVEYKVIGDYVVADEVFDSDELNFGSEKVKEARALKIELENAADVTVTIFSDIPGGALVQRGSPLTITANATRRIVEIPFASGAFFRGRNFRIKMTSASDWALYGAELEIRVIGEYVFGSSGKIYDSGELDWQTERMKWAKELEFDYESSGIVTIACWSDIPGGVLALRLSPTLASSASVRKTGKIRLPATFQGRLHRFKASTVSSDFILYAGRERIKMVGEPGATPWVWRDLPIAQTAEGQWGWGKLPVVPSESNAWRWFQFQIDRAA